MPGLIRVLEEDAHDTETQVAALETLESLCVSGADDVGRVLVCAAAVVAFR